MYSSSEDEWIRFEQTRNSFTRFGIDMTDPLVTIQVACEATSLLTSLGLLDQASPELRLWVRAHAILDMERTEKERQDVVNQQVRAQRDTLKHLIENASPEQLIRLRVEFDEKL